jgi:hypothetical protein
LHGPEAEVAVTQLVEDLARRGGLDAKLENGRIPFNVQVNVGRVRETWFKKITAAWAFDISRDGIGLITDRTLTVGETFFIEMPSVTGEEQVIAARVAYSFKLFGSLYRVGMTFQEPAAAAD